VPHLQSQQPPVGSRSVGSAVSLVSLQLEPKTRLLLLLLPLLAEDFSDSEQRRMLLPLLLRKPACALYQLEHLVNTCFDHLYSPPAATDKPAAPAASTNLFSGFGNTAQKESSTPAPTANADAAAKAPPAAASPFGGFGAPAASAAPASTKPAEASTSLFGAAPPSTSTPAQTSKPSAGSSSLNPNAQINKTVKLGEPAPSFVKGKTFNEIVERFEQELGTQVKTFKDQAAEVREWDLVLMQNASNVSRHPIYVLRVPADLLRDRYIDCRPLLRHATSRDRTGQYSCDLGRG
jgi:hypothetical protein